MSACCNKLLLYKCASFCKKSKRSFVQFYGSELSYLIIRYSNIRAERSRSAASNSTYNTDEAFETHLPIVEHYLSLKTILCVAYNCRKFCDFYTCPEIPHECCSLYRSKEVDRNGCPVCLPTSIVSEFGPRCSVWVTGLPEKMLDRLIARFEV